MTTPKYLEERSKVLIGNLPEDFLRVHSPHQDNQERPPVNGTSHPGYDTSHIVHGTSHPAHGTSHPAHGTSHPVQAARPHNYSTSTVVNEITICIVQAKLVKNYSLTKMDPYCKIRIGHSVFETRPDPRGGKFPNWNRTITTILAPGIKTIHIDVYDEHTLTPDERIAYVEYEIPPEVMNGKFTDVWVPLSGKQGDGKEGSINITVYINSVPHISSILPYNPAATYNRMMTMPQPMAYPYYLPGQPLPVGYPIIRDGLPLHNHAPNLNYPVNPSPPYEPSEEDVKQMQEMFPAYDKEVILGVLESCRGNKEQVITSLLSLSDK